MIYDEVHVQCDFCKTQARGSWSPFLYTKDRIKKELTEDGWKFFEMFGVVKKVYCPACAKKSEQLEGGKK